MNTFTISEALSYGWHKFKEHWVFLVVFTLVFFAIGTVSSGEDRNIALKILGIFVNLFGMFTLVRIGLMIDAGQKPTTKSVFSLSWKMFWRYVLASIIFTAAYVAGLVVLIVPGIILVVRLGFFGFALIEEDMRPLESLKRSWSLTRDSFWKLLGFSLVLLLVNIAGALVLGVGVLVTSPLTLLATIHVYQKLKALPVKTIEPLPVPAQTQ